MLYNETARLVDLLQTHGGVRDFAAETQYLTGLIREINPGASSLLDVGCGCGHHLHHFAHHFAHVEGVDLSPGMVRVARERNPDVPIHEGDMCTIRFERSFDAIVSLSSSIPVLLTFDALESAVGNLALSLAGGGVLVLQAFPGAAVHTQGDQTVTSDVLSVRRVQSFVPDAQDPSICVNTVHYVATMAPGPHGPGGDGHLTEVHHWKMWPSGVWRDVIEAAGLAFHRGPQPSFGGGLYLGVKLRGPAEA